MVISRKTNNLQSSNGGTQDVHGTNQRGNIEQRVPVPLSAYILGHESTFIRMFQVQRWQSEVPLVGNAVTESLTEIEKHLLPMLQKQDERLDEFKRIRDEFAGVSNNVFALVFLPGDTPFHWLDETATGCVVWKELVSFVSTTIAESSPDRPWFEFGRALAEFQMRLHLLSTSARLGLNPSLRTFVHWAGVLQEQGWHRIPTIREFAASRDRLGELTTQQILGNAVDTSERNRRLKSNSDSLVRSILQQTNMIDRKLRAALRGAALENVESKLAKPDDGVLSSSNEILDETQKDILKALDGKAMMKEELATAIGLSDPSMLYRKNRMKTLKQRKLVINKRGVGYFRPETPPLELDFKSYLSDPDDGP